MIWVAIYCYEPVQQYQSESWDIESEMREKDAKKYTDEFLSSKESERQFRTDRRNFYAVFMII